MREMTDFSGGVFHTSLADGRAAAEIQVTSVGLVARTTDDQVFEIPFGECLLDVGGASGRMVFCRTHDRQLTIFCEHKEFPAALELESVGEVSDELARLFRRNRHEDCHLPDLPLEDG